MMEKATMTTTNATTSPHRAPASAAAPRSTASAPSGFFKPATEAPSFLKCGIYGDPGTGKTYSASLVACGLAQRIGKAPVLFLDTEGGSVWVRGIFEKVGVPFFVRRSRAFKDLKSAVAEAERMGGILLIDSVTHFWEEIREAFLKAKRERTRNPNARLELPDWNVIKPTWGEFTTLFLNAQCHIVICGRGASVYEFIDREDDPAKKDMITSGTRMAAEKGLGYEPSLLIEMVSRQTVAAGKKKTITRIATVLKDRSDLLDGQQFEDPTFENFLPHIEYLNIGGSYVAFDESRSSEGLFPVEGSGRDAYGARRLVVLDDTKDLLLKHIPGQTVADKQRKTEIFRKHFGCGWVEAEELASLEQLKAGYISLKAELEPAPTAPAAAPIDEIPFTGEPEAPPTATLAPAPAPVALSPLVGAQLADSIVKQFEEDMERVHNKTRCTQLWKSYEPSYNKLDEERQKRMLLIKQWAETRIMHARAKARDAVLGAADDEAAKQAAQ